MRRGLGRELAALAIDVAHATGDAERARAIVYAAAWARAAIGAEGGRARVVAALPRAHSILREVFDEAFVSPSRPLASSIDRLFAFLDRAPIPPLDRPGEADLARAFEEMLAASEPALRGSRGVYATPPEIAGAMVRGAIDAPFSRALEGADVVDLALGTGTFFAALVEALHERFAGGARAWERYAREELLPRLHGVEILLAPLAAAYLRLELAFARTGVKLSASDVVDLRLANALDEPRASFGDPARPLLVVGNPPYSGVSSNSEAAHQELVEAYKDVGGARLDARKHWLGDDYVKFFRFAEELGTARRCAAIAFVTNHGWVHNPTFRGMRRSLLASFPFARVLDLGGAALKRGSGAPSNDANLFGIRRGVAVAWLARGPALARDVAYAELEGDAGEKTRALAAIALDDPRFRTSAPAPPSFSIVPSREAEMPELAHAFALPDIFPEFVAGIVTARDHVVVDVDRDALLARIAELRGRAMSDEALRAKYWRSAAARRYPPGDTRGFKLASARAALRADPSWRERVRDVLYRPFDVRSIYYARSVVDWPREKALLPHVRARRLFLAAPRTVEIARGFEHVFCSRELMTHHAVARKEVNYAFVADRISPSFERELAARYGERTANASAAFGLVYATLHSASYRARFATRLRQEFAPIPLPSSPRLFEELSALGAKLARAHLFEDGASADDEARVALARADRAWLALVSSSAATFSIGGYPVLATWLRDRRGRALSTEDAARFFAIARALDATIELGRRVDRLIDAAGGFPNAFR